MLACRVLIACFGALLASAAIAANRDMTSVCRHFAGRIPGITRVQCEAARLQASEGRSVNGRIIWSRDISSPEPNLRVIIVAGVHGDELSSVTVALNWIDLAEHSPIDVFQPVYWRFIPVLNPDGVFAVRSHRVNANGVDLNRNFPTPNWARESRAYWEQKARRDPRRWPGPKSLSEPESKFLHDQIESFKPNLIVSIHAPYGVLDFDGPLTPPSRLGKLHLDLLGIFPGSLGNYGGAHRGIPVVTIELPNANQALSQAETRNMWLDLQSWINTRLSLSAGVRTLAGAPVNAPQY
jgi:hypothetical protein